MKRGCNGNGHERIETSPNDNDESGRYCAAALRIRSSHLIG
jgi:hypothetical protein